MGARKRKASDLVDEHIAKREKYRDASKKIKNSVSISSLSSEIENLEAKMKALQKYSTICDGVKGYEYMAIGIEKITEAEANLQNVIYQYKSMRTELENAKKKIDEKFQYHDDEGWRIQNEYNEDKDDGDFWGINTMHYGRYF